MTTTSRVNRRIGAAIALVPATAVAALVLGITPADASPGTEQATATTPLTLVQTHTWAQTPKTAAALNHVTGSGAMGEARPHTSHLTANHLDAMQPSGTWIDGVHGPVLDGALLSTPMLVLLLLGVAALALFMAGRASAVSAVAAERPASGDPR